MAKKTGPRLRELPKETQTEIKRQRAAIMTHEVKIADSRNAINEHRANIIRLKGS